MYQEELGYRGEGVVEKWFVVISPGYFSSLAKVAQPNVIV